jgi:hypothetical protein
MKTACRNPHDAEIPRTPSRNESAIEVGFRWSHRVPRMVIPDTHNAAIMYPDPDLAAAFTRRLYDKDKVSRFQSFRVSRLEQRTAGFITLNLCNLETLKPCFITFFSTTISGDAQDSRSVAGGMFAD